MTPVETRAGDWWEARKAGQRLAEHVLEEEEMGDPTVPVTPVLASKRAIGDADPGDTCELCFRPMRPEEIDPETVKATGFLICNACVEETLSASADNSCAALGLARSSGGR